ncbi:unnamed protein product [Allacma fusca]|uniref:Uncharacterized protein n=1 Tax=Allacma fusca TaxID=39272 RepID=A0A8J2K9H1_9HEXA|nr:unnamed protein product [Allacma fusca]
MLSLKSLFQPYAAYRTYQQLQELGKSMMRILLSLDTLEGSERTEISQNLKDYTDLFLRRSSGLLLVWGRFLVILCQKGLTESWTQDKAL